MNWNDYEAVWRRQTLPLGVNADITALRASFETTHRRMKKLLVLRDWLEAGAGLFVSAALGLFWWRIGKAGWPIAVALLLILGVTWRFLRERLRAHRNQLGPQASLLAKVEADIAELRHQHRLLRQMGVWYYLPLIGAMMIVFITLIRRTSRQSPPGLITELLTNPAALAWIIALASVTVLATGRAWQAKGEAIRKQIEPRLAELEALRREILLSK